MNRTPLGSLALSKAIAGFVNFKTAEGLATTSLATYERALEKWMAHIGDVDVSKITSKDITDYLSWLRSEYTPQRFNGKTHPLSPKTLRNVWITLSSFFSWAKTEFNIPSPMKDVPPPRFKRTPVETYTQEEVERMLKACVYSKEAKTQERRKFVMRRATGHRDQAIVLMLLDTGLRALELCSLRIGDLDTKTT